MTALEELRTRLASPHNLTGANDRLFAAALLELAARLDALEAEKPKHAPCAQCGNEAVVLGDHVIFYKGRILCGECYFAQESVAKE